jgi:hypothetical protein
MKLSDFIMLNEEEKKLAVLHRGVLISKRKTPGYIAFLFHFSNFYVETFCNMESKGVTQYQVFTHTKLLQPYLDAIAIDDVFSAD